MFFRGVGGDDNDDVTEEDGYGGFRTSLSLSDDENVWRDFLVWHGFGRGMGEISHQCVEYEFQTVVFRICHFECESILGKQK
jgi:hypothetical protein